ncbi:unnamed protein product, partial [Prorocentrum cordatum]
AISAQVHGFGPSPPLPPYLFPSLSSSPLPPPPPPHPRLEQMSQCQAMDFGQMFSQMGKLDGDLGKHGMDMKQLVDDAAQYALKDDWRCMDGSPSCGALPGLRYGASVEIRPRLLVLPCPCAGGQWTPPVANSDDGILQADGLWAARVPWRQQHRPSHPAGTEEDWLEADGQEGNPVVSANPLMSIFSSFGAMGAKLGKQLRRLVAGTPRPTSMMLGSIVGKQLRSLVGNPKYYPGSEPYAMDYGCAKGPVSKAFDGIQPGKRRARPVPPLSAPVSPPHPPPPACLTPPIRDRLRFSWDSVFLQR